MMIKIIFDKKMIKTNYLKSYANSALRRFALSTRKAIIVN
jgi:hypothetical protein